MASEYTPTDEQVYDALMVFRVAQTDYREDPAGKYLAALAVHGEPTPDDPLWEPMRAALRAALRETEADAGLHAEAARRFGAERDALARRIEVVRELHHPWGDTLTGKYICDACDHPLPCPTIRALDGEV